MTASSGPDWPSDVERVRLLYCDTIVPVKVLAAGLGIGTESFYRRLEGWGWPRRRPTQAPKAARPSRARSRPPAIPPAEGTAQRMERFIAERLSALATEAASGRDADPERTARTIAHYARALQVMQATKAQAEKEPRPDESEPPARSLSELRDELRGHLERIWDEGRTQRRARPAEPDAG